MSYYDLNRPYSIDDWNGLIRAVNNILQNPPTKTDCDPIASIDEVSDPHLWSVSDIEGVRNKLIQTCPDISFSEPMELWTPGMIDEIASALGQTWCDCEEECTDEFKHEENGTQIVIADYEYTIYHGCGGPYPQPGGIDASTLEGMQAAKPGLKWRSVIVKYEPEELWGGNIGRGIGINCDGTLGYPGSWKYKGSHGHTPWCPGGPDWDSCCNNQIWLDNVLYPWLAYAEGIENLQVVLEIYTRYAECCDEEE